MKVAVIDILHYVSQNSEVYKSLTPEANCVDFAVTFGTYY